MHGRELETLLKEDRGQFFEFVSAYEHRKRGVQTKRPRDLAREVARILDGMANADGGALLVGVEPDKSLTGLPYADDEVRGRVPPFDPGHHLASSLAIHDVHFETVCCRRTAATTGLR